MIAYNYLTQEWVHGEEAVLVQRVAIEQEIALLRSPEGPAYARFMSISVEDALKDLAKMLEAL